MKKSLYNSGYTIVEMMVTVSIFALAFIAMAAIFLGFNTAQSNASVSQRLLNEGNHMFEAIAREIRMNSIDYDCGVIYGSDNSKVCLKSLDTGESIHFRVEGAWPGTVVQVCSEIEDPACTDVGDWNTLNVGFIHINKFTFRVFPDEDPSTTSDPDKVSQPMVLINMSMQAGTGKAVQTYDFQTLVSSRVYNY